MAREYYDQIDNSTQIVTPENIAFQYQAAGPFRRLPAFVIDMAIQVLILFCIFAVGALTIGLISGGMFLAILIVSQFVLSWFYGGVLETFWNGQTIGKRITGLRVLTVDGEPINGLQAVMRNVFRFADSLPFAMISFGFINADLIIPLPTFALGLLAMSLNERFQRVGDIVCGTMVVVEDRQWLTGVVRLEDPRVAQLSELLPLDFIVSRTLSRTLAHYVERRRFFSQARRREIARHIAEPLLPRFKLPADTSHDLVLCALYHRAFVSERAEEVGSQSLSPFGPVVGSAPGPAAVTSMPVIDQIPSSITRREQAAPQQESH